MLKNVFLPLLMIVLTGTGTVLCWYEEAPRSYLGFVGIITLGIGSIYLGYYAGYALLPDKRNKPLPALFDIMSLSRMNKAGAWTKGSSVGCVLSLAFIGTGWYTMRELADKYKSYHINEFGREVKAIVIATGHTKGMGKYAKYQFRTDDGKVYSDRCEQGILVIGDTIRVIYSSQKPVINEVIKTWQ